jgi:4'-phosphopantetheinyl transferase
MAETWPPGPNSPVLDPQTIHVWQADLTVPAAHLARYEAWLAGDERERAARFRFERDRNRYIAGRGMLRLLIGRYLQQAPEALDFSYSKYNKPGLPGSELQFNLAHSGELALFAFGLHDALGVDLEAERPLRDALAIARRFFSPSERESLASLPEDQQASAFFRCWTRKEAFIKAVGEGLSYPLDGFDVTLLPGEPARLLTVRGSEDEARSWTVRHLEPAPGYVAALVARGPGKHLEYWHFHP